MNDIAGTGEKIQQAYCKERIAVRPLPNQRRKLVRKLIGLESAAQQNADFVVGEGVQHDIVARLPRFHVCDAVFQSVIWDLDIFRTDCGEHQYALCL